MKTIDVMRKKLRADLKAACKSHLSALSEAEIEDIPDADEAHGFIDMLVRESRPIVSLHPAPLSEASTVGSSRIVGMPDMPLVLDWPDYEGRPMAFLAQFDLAKLPSAVDWPVPKSGWLYLFLAEATTKENDVQRRQDVIVTGRYFGGALEDLQPRRAPANAAQPNCLASVASRSIDFGLALCPPITQETFSGYSWAEEYPNCNLLLGLDENENELELDTEGLIPLLADHDDRLFGYRHFNAEQIVDVRMWAAIRGAGFHQIALFPETASATTKTYDTWRVPDTSKQEFAAFAKQRAAIKSESAHWEQLLSLGKSCGFEWGPFANGLQVFVDERKSATGDFSSLQSFNRYLNGYD